MASERKFKVEYKEGKNEVKGSVSAESAPDAIRKMFPKAGTISLRPAEIIYFYFEAQIEGGKTIKGEVRQARRSKEDGTEEES